jgi:hypothetical protein
MVTTATPDVRERAKKPTMRPELAATKPGCSTPPPGESIPPASFNLLSNANGADRPVKVWRPSEGSLNVVAHV